MASALIGARGYDPTDIGTIMGSMFLASAAVQLPAGVLYDRLGPRTMLGTMNLVAVVGILLFAFAGSAQGLTAGRTLIGVGHGTVIAGIYILAVAWVPPDKVATVAAMVIGIAGGIGALLATTPLALTIAELGFATTFTALAVLTLGVQRRHLRHRARRPGRRRRAVGAPDRGFLAEPARLEGGRGGSRSLGPFTSWEAASRLPFSPSVDCGPGRIFATCTAWAPPSRATCCSP